MANEDKNDNLPCGRVGGCRDWMREKWAGDVAF